jgi:hypothetical protein
VTTLTGDSRFYIIPRGFEPGSLVTGSKRVVHWTSEIAGCPQYTEIEYTDVIETKS